MVYTTRSGGELLLNFQKKKSFREIHVVRDMNLAPNEDLRCFNRVAHVC